MMILDPSFGRLQKRSLIRFLEKNGWSARTSKDGALKKFTYKDEKLSGDVNVIIDIRPTVAVTAKQYFDIVTTISQVYDSTIDAIVEKIKSISFDIIYSKIPDEYVSDKSIKLGTANQFIICMRSILAATATTEAGEGRSFPRNKKEATQYADDCRFGHTFEGSFGFTVESPIGFNDTPELFDLPSAAPFGRRVVSRLAEGLQCYEVAVLERSIDPLVSEGSGLSSNMCDELAAILEDTNLSKVEFSFEFSPEWTTPAISKDRSFSLEIGHLELLRDASNRLRATEKPKQCSIVGRITQLKTESNPSDLLDLKNERDVLVSWDSPEYGHIRVLMKLNPVDYLEAANAHMAGKFIVADGVLSKSGRSWVLSDITAVRTVNP
ncbi:hypothetical protein NS365_01175 [Aureimonas ureilytica]|uniref:Uncharacterized protein n=1 Tax=Aureimonas ureilytica TaxID=401562 RepID=A0A147DBM8_9HYPH|nr:hypothetical protein [Aureimonas ureilytica]KTR08577.1 hypothetical protein NS365_01175 [Aureimonas ureilytica]